MNFFISILTNEMTFHIIRLCLCFERPLLLRGYEVFLFFIKTSTITFFAYTLDLINVVVFFTRVFMQKKLDIRISEAQRKALKKILPRGDLAIWVSEAICDLLIFIENDKAVDFSFLYSKRSTRTSSLSCWFSESEAESLSKIIEKIKEDRKSFSKTHFAYEAIRRKMTSMIDYEDKDIKRKSHFLIRIDPNIKRRIKEGKKRRVGSKRHLVSHWLAEAAEELLNDTSSINPFIGQNGFEERPIITSIMATNELKERINSTVLDIKKINPKFSIALWMSEAARRKMKRECVCI